MRSAKLTFTLTASLALALTPLALAQDGAPNADVAAGAQTPPAQPTPNDYRDPANWICRPGRDDACASDLDLTRIASDGSQTQVAFERAEAAPVDCFYVYPTVSTDATPNSDMKIGPEENRVAVAQLARFGSQCRIFAPLYRQITLTALRAFTAGQRVPANPQLAYSDVVDAWNHYLANDNQGRGVVLIGHSQGAGVLTRLIQQEIEGKPVQDNLISALLIGSNLAVPKGKDVGGAFKKIPLCRATNQTGCAIAYVSFRADSPPPADSRFGKVSDAGMVAACTNPAALSGGPATLDARLSTSPDSKEIPTRFFDVPGMLAAECVDNEAGSYLAVTVTGDPQDARMDDIPGDVIGPDGKPVRSWGLHLIDMNLAMGNLVSIVEQQSRAYLSSRR